MRTIKQSNKSVAADNLTDNCKNILTKINNKTFRNLTYLQIK